LATLGDRLMREDFLRNRAVAMARVACHVGRSEGRVLAVTLVWQRKHIDERIGRGILPESTHEQL
jgi:hypothetical protein